MEVLSMSPGEGSARNATMLLSTSPTTSNESGASDSDSESTSSSSVLDEEEADFDFDAQSSAFTQLTSPSSLGSALAALQAGGSVGRSQGASRRRVAVDEEQETPLRRQIRAAYEMGLSLTREALLLDLDQESSSSLSSPDSPYSAQLSGKSPARSHWPSLKQVPEPTRIFACANCGAALALQDELISKAFSGRDGKAYLFFSVFNTQTGPKEDRQLLTGLHTVADLACAGCKRSVGWYYLRAYQAAQRYKEGKFILERAALQKINNWSL